MAEINNNLKLHRCDPLVRLLGLFLIFGILLIPIGINRIEALQQVAGPIVFEMKPGDTKTMQWGLVSDEDKPVTLQITASGAGSELLSFPKTVDIGPRQTVLVNITAAVPADHPNNVELNPSIYATELGQQGGSTIINIQMQKILSIKIGTPTIPEFGPIAAIVLALAIISIIALSAKTKLRFMPKY